MRRQKHPDKVTHGVRLMIAVAIRANRQDVANGQAGDVLGQLGITLLLRDRRLQGGTACHGVIAVLTYCNKPGKRVVLEVLERYLWVKQGHTMR